MKVAIAGAGAVGRSIARELLENEHEVTLIERNAEHIDVDAIPAAHWRLGDAHISVIRVANELCAVLPSRTTAVDLARAINERLGL